MSSPQRDPWWASGTGPGGHDEAAADPIDAHRAARRGADRSPPPGAGEAGGHGGAGADPVDTHDVDVCGVCPICTGLRALGEVRPELVAHLTDAARHLAAAARTLFDDASRPGAATDDPPDEGVTRIDLD